MFDHVCYAFLCCWFIPHWSVFCSGALHDLRRWKKLCYIPHARIHTASHQCVSAGVFSGSQDESMLCCNPQTTVHKKHMVKDNAMICRDCMYEKRKTHQSNTHSALVRFFASVSAHMHHQHILSLKWSLLTRTVLPVANKFFFLTMDMLIIYVLKEDENEMN